MTFALYDLQDATSQLRDWLRAVEHPDTDVPLINNVSVFAGGLPSTHDATVAPAIVLYRVGGPYDPPLDIGLYQFDIWAPTRSAGDAASNGLISVLTSFVNVDMGNHFRFKGANVISVAFVPDPDPSIYHRAVTAEVVTTHHATS